MVTEEPLLLLHPVLNEVLQFHAPICAKAIELGSIFILPFTSGKAEDEQINSVANLTSQFLPLLIVLLLLSGEQFGVDLGVENMLHVQPNNHIGAKVFDMHEL